MVRSIMLVTLLAAATMAGTGTAISNPRHHRHHHAHAGARPGPTGHAGIPYGAAQAPTPDCRYPDGTPFDPDIIGGAKPCRRRRAGREPGRFRSLSGY